MQKPSGTGNGGLFCTLSRELHWMGDAWVASEILHGLDVGHLLSMDLPSVLNYDSGSGAGSLVLL